MTVSSDRTDTSIDTTVRVVAPDGWTVQPESFPVSLRPGGHAQQTVTVTPSSPEPGCYWLRSRIDIAGEQTVEDVTRVLVGTVDEREFDVRLDGPVELRAGGEQVLTATITNHARTEISGRVQLISPWHTWELADRWDTGVSIAAGSSEQVEFAVRVPPGADAGTWWALVKVAIAGSVHYTEPVSVVVRR